MRYSLIALAACAWLGCASPRPAAPVPEVRADPERVESDVRTLAGFGTRHTLSETGSNERGIGAARRWLVAELERISASEHDGRLQVQGVSYAVEPATRLPAGANVVNILAVLPGSDPERLVVVSGHYDSIPSDVMDATADAPGANDDASGVAVVLECARLCGGLRPRATIVFMAVAGEEQHLSGSTAQAASWREQGFEVEAMITNDIVGGDRLAQDARDRERVRLFSEGVPSSGTKVVGSDNDSPSRQLARFIAEQSRTPDFEVELVFRQDRFLRGGDHRPFNLQGWAAVRFTEARENYAHQHQDVRSESGLQYGDLPEFVDFDYVARVATANALAVQALALAPRPPAKVTIDTSKLSPDTRLVWDVPDDGSVASYRVRMRRTNEPTWTRTVDVGLVSEAVLERMSKDDWIFAVEALDSEGRPSVPVYPTPSR